LVNIHFNHPARRTGLAAAAKPSAEIPVRRQPPMIRLIKFTAI